MLPLLLRLKCHNKCTKEAPSCRISFLPSKPCLNPDPVGIGHTLCDISNFFLPVAKIRRTESVPSDINNPVDRPQEAPQFGTLPKAITKKVESLYASALRVWSEEKSELTYIYYIFDSLYFMFGYAWDKSRILVLTRCLRNVLNTFIGDLHLIEVTADPIRIILQCWTSWIPAATRPPPPRPRLPLQHPSSRAIPPVPRHHPTPHPKATGTAASTFQVGVMIQSAVYIKCV